MKVNLPPVKKARIEMLPLMDIVFLLLVVFIYSMLSMSVHNGMEIDLPESTTAVPDKNKILSITVQKNNKIYVNETWTSLEELPENLKKLSADQTDPGVLLFAHKEISYQYLFKVLDHIKSAGLNQISLQAELKGNTLKHKGGEG